MAPTINKRAPWCALAALAISGAASAQVYKCPDASGRTVMQQTPCAGGQKVIVQPASGDGRSDMQRSLDASMERIGRARKEFMQEMDAKNASREQAAQHAQTLRAQTAQREKEAAEAEQKRRADHLAASLAEMQKKLSPDAIAKDCGTPNIPEIPSIGMDEARMHRCTLIGRSDALQLVDTIEIQGSVTKQFRSTLDSVKFVFTRNGRVSAIHR